MAKLNVKVEIPQQKELIEAALALCSFELRRRWDTGGALCKVCRAECLEGGTIEHTPECQVGRMMNAIYAFDEAKTKLSSDKVSPRNNQKKGDS